MRWLHIASVLLAPYQARAAAVFSHFMVIANANLAKINALAAQVEATVVFNEAPFNT
ncbi:uncharacterized protein EAF02_009616 [Botrytis sinoallii]|uniref:uncharacterized protein n=1 Tax=Botrytis sinoallii TaxID=1463999 RepID=UPI0019018D85|nr:uncharacterized protein EAF02_009616 [Botrytis sinoallii]KAF7868880.1 hypothetical protein EAF02_009616 [Botrytis sinoallii]